MNKKFQISLLIYSIIIFLIGCTSAQVFDIPYKAREKDIFDRYKPIIGNKYNGEQLFLKDFVLANRKINGFQPFVFRAISSERFMDIVYSTLIDLDMNVSKLDSGENKFIFDKYYLDASKELIFDITTGETSKTSKNMEHFVSQHYSNFFLKEGLDVLPCLEFEDFGSSRKQFGSYEVYGQFTMHFYIYLFDKNGSVIYKNQKSMNTKEPGLYNYDFSRAEATDLPSFEQKFQMLIKETIKDFIE